MKTDAPILKIQHLSYRYPSGRVALCDVNFSIALGESVGLVGPNGAGKTTLLQHLNGLLLGSRLSDDELRRGGVNTATAGRPTDGDVDAIGQSHPVEVLGMPVVPQNLMEVRRIVGFMFQDPDDQLFCPTVGDDVGFGPLNLGFPLDEVRRRITDSLTAVGLPGYEDRTPQELSFGERRRVCLAGVLACEPNLLALDEPSSNLDPRARRGLIELLRNLDAARFIASHDLEMILELCQRVLVLDHGRIQANGPAEDVLADERLMAAHGLEVPLSIKLGRTGAGRRG